MHAIYLGDCCEVLPSFPKETIHLSVYSPPFGGLYCYSSSDRDLSNASGYDEFFRHYEFVVRGLARVTMPGRISAVHCMDIPSGNTGNDYLTDFPGNIIRLHAKHGFRYVTRYVVWKKASPSATKLNEEPFSHDHRGGLFPMLFRARGLSFDLPKTGREPGPHHASERLNRLCRGSARSPGSCFAFAGGKGASYRTATRIGFGASTLRPFGTTSAFGGRLICSTPRIRGDEQHVHPLQLDVIERCIILWSNPGETVLTPFMGVASEVCGALLNGRRGVGIELKPSYYRAAKRNIEYVLREGRVPTKTGSLLPADEGDFTGEKEVEGETRTFTLQGNGGRGTGTVRQRAERENDQRTV